MISSHLGTSKQAYFVDPPKEDEELQSIPKSSVIFVENNSIAHSLNGETVLFRKFESNFEFSEGLQPRGTVLIRFKAVENVIVFYEASLQKKSSPWKGMNSYISGKELFESDPNSKDSMIWTLQKICKEPKYFQSSGFLIRYEMTAFGRINLLFYLQNDRIDNTLNEFCEYKEKRTMYSIFKRRGQTLLSAILYGKPKYDIFTQRENVQIQDHIDTDFDLLFENVNAYRKKYAEKVPSYKLKLQNLNCQLMNYQKETVRWMIHRESGQKNYGDVPGIMLCEELTTPDGKQYYYYPFLGAITKNQTCYLEQLKIARYFRLNGGILADEMGLGKTVQVLALISAHKKGKSVEVENEESFREEAEDVLNVDEQRQSVAEQVRIAEKSYREMIAAKSGAPAVAYNMTESSEASTVTCQECFAQCRADVCGWDWETAENEYFTCPECLTKNETRRELKTTLIILPESLIFQWFTEIAKHCADSVKVMFYFGVRKHAYIQPRELGTYDVILTTNDTIRMEMAFTDNLDNTRTTRNAFRPLFVKSPLLHVKFWRVIVDESQIMPQTTNANLSQMISRIQAENWWCVTGTPLVKRVADFSSLFSFLKLYPFSHPEYFSFAHKQYLNMVHRLQESNISIDERWPCPNLLLEALALHMRRNTKENVESELKLPPLEEFEQTVCFSLVEERSYTEEKERLKKIVENCLRNTPNTHHLANLSCRDKILHELNTLRDLIFSGQNARSSRMKGKSTGTTVYAQETVIFRLYRNKKTAVEEFFREFTSNALGLSAVYQLDKKLHDALHIYEDILEKQKEIFNDGLSMTAVLGEDIVAKIQEGEAPIEQNDEEEDNEEFNVEDDYTPEEELKKKKKVTSWLRNFKSLVKKYQKVEESNCDEPPMKKARVLNDVPAVTAEQSDEMERKDIIRKVAALAFKPIGMDETQEWHLVTNMLNLQAKRRLPPGDRISLDRLEPVLGNYLKLEIDAIQMVRNDLSVLTTTFESDQESKMSELLKVFIEMMDNSDIVDPFQSPNGELRNELKKGLVPRLPFIPFYNTTPPANPSSMPRHAMKSCMGGCEPAQMENEQFFEEKCLPMTEVIGKTRDHVKKIGNRLKDVEKQLNQMIDIALDLGNPHSLRNAIALHQSKTSLNATLFCEHMIFKGRVENQEDVNVYYFKQHECELCDLWCKLSFLIFEVGLSSFHGTRRAKSGVLDLILYLVRNTATGKVEAERTMKDVFEPFFERIQDTMKAFENIVEILFEFYFKLNELAQAQTLLTDEQIRSQYPPSILNVDRAENRAWRRKKYAATHVCRRDDALKKCRQELRELTYLGTLIKQQMMGEVEDECGICSTMVQSFMVFKCGHRLCVACYNAMLEQNRNNLLIPARCYDIVRCATCRTPSNSKQVMIAQVGLSEKRAVIPGMMLSSKMTKVIELVRDIIASDDTNKIILFTSCEPSTRVWNYLTDILTRSKIPFSVTVRGSCGKKVVDFDISEEIKVLLCSLSLCSSGLNITGANNIIFLDPPHLRSVLHQAIGRINRFGQKRAMKVYHMMVKGSLDVELRESAKKPSCRKKEQKGWTVGDIRVMFDIEDPNARNNQEAVVPDVPDQLDF